MTEKEKMKLTYIFHSGFVLETEHTILVFDYWLDPSGVMEILLYFTWMHIIVRSSLGSAP